MNKILSATGNFDQFLSARLIWPAIRNRTTDNSFAIPILMYHSISDDLDLHRAPYYRTVTSPQTFASHLRILKSERFKVVTLSEALELLRDGGTSSQDRLPVVITFDDGLQDFFTHAFPLLENENLTATVFATSGCIDGVFPTGDLCLSSDQIRELSQYGIEFGSHTVTHARLIEQTAQQLERELVDSKARIEMITGCDVNLFSYPYRFPAENKTFVHYLNGRLLANGYRAGVTTIVARATENQNVMLLPRLPISDRDDEQFFRAKLFGAYDWVGRAQFLFKKLNSMVSKTRVRLGN